MRKIGQIFMAISEKQNFTHGIWEALKKSEMFEPNVAEKYSSTVIKIWV